MSTTARNVTALFVMAIMSLAAGCKSFNLKKNIPWNEDVEVPEKHVVKMVTAWSEAALNKPGQPPMRGFGGRVYFYNRFDQPVQVDGNLVVYAYENRSALPSDAPPDRKFVITSRQLATHYSDGPMGPSYSFWLPWDELGGDPTDIDLIPTFAPKIGEVVVGVQAQQRLPGNDSLAKTKRQSPSRRSATAAHAGPVMPVSYRESENAHLTGAYGSDSGDVESGESEKRTEVTTIAVPEIVRKRMELSRNRPRGTNADRTTYPTAADGPMRQIESYRATMSAVQNQPSPRAESTVPGREAAYDSPVYSAEPNRPTNRDDSYVDSQYFSASTSFTSRPNDPRSGQQRQRKWPPGPAPYYWPPNQPARENQAFANRPIHNPTSAMR